MRCAVDFGQHAMGGDLIARSDVQRLHDARDRRCVHVLHLHRFQRDQHRISRGDALAPPPPPPRRRGRSSTRAAGRRRRCRRGARSRARVVSTISNDTPRCASHRRSPSRSQAALSITPSQTNRTRGGELDHLDGVALRVPAAPRGGMRPAASAWPVCVRPSISPAQAIGSAGDKAPPGVAPGTRRCLEQQHRGQRAGAPIGRLVPAQQRMRHAAR